MTNLRLYSNNKVNGPFTPVGNAQADAVQIYPGINILIDSGSGGNGIALPDAIEGTVVMAFVVGVQSNWIAVWAKNGTEDQINGFSNGADFVFPNGPPGIGQIMVAACVTDGAWSLNCVDD